MVSTIGTLSAVISPAGANGVIEWLTAWVVCPGRSDHHWTMAEGALHSAAKRRKNCARWGPERIVTMAFFAYGLVWMEHPLTHGDRPALVVLPWDRGKHSPWCLDALAAFRTQGWITPINGQGGVNPTSRKITPEMIQILSQAR